MCYLFIFLFIHCHKLVFKGKGNSCPGVFITKNVLFELFN